MTISIINELITSLFLRNMISYDYGCRKTWASISKKTLFQIFVCSVVGYDLFSVCTWLRVICSLNWYINMLPYQNGLLNLNLLLHFILNGVYWIVLHSGLFSRPKCTAFAWFFKCIFLKGVCAKKSFCSGIFGRPKCTAFFLFFKCIFVWCSKFVVDFALHQTFRNCILFMFQIRTQVESILRCWE